MKTTELVPHRLEGGFFARGLGQAAIGAVPAHEVRHVVETRYAEAHAVLESETARDFLRRQSAFARQWCAPQMSELDGICEGFGVDPSQAFALLHLSALSGRYETDGCTAWAGPAPGGGAILVKNRDLTGAHRNFQDVFLHDDPASPVGPVLCVGTFGAPSVYSSGLNAEGLAIADTAIQAPRHGVGWLRYFLMSRIAFSCANVDEALDVIVGARHSGGGSLILADASGAVACVELLAEGARISREAPAFRANHFLCEPIEDVAARLAPAAFASTKGRYANLAERFGHGLGDGGVQEAARVMADHGGEGREGFCRHGVGDGSHTVSTAIYLTSQLSLTFSRGRPCEGRWERGSIGGGS